MIVFEISCNTQEVQTMKAILSTQKYDMTKINMKTCLKTSFILKSPLRHFSYFVFVFNVAKSMAGSQDA